MRNHLTSIVAIDRRGAIGCKNRLPWSIKSDMAFFRKTTMGNAVIMGRKTYDSIGGCLKGRQNLVLSHSATLFPSTETCRLVNSVDESLAIGLKMGENESFVIGGAATYLEYAPLVDRYLVTMVDHEAEDADAFLATDIMNEFQSWKGEEIAYFPAEAGRDEFAFRILSFSAPDSHERLETRKALGNQFLSKALSQTKRSAGGSKLGQPALQSAFLF
jgi:dihydrofolate reductase